MNWCRRLCRFFDLSLCWGIFVSFDDLWRFICTNGTCSTIQWMVFLQCIEVILLEDGAVYVGTRDWTRSTTRQLHLDHFRLMVFFVDRAVYNDQICRWSWRIMSSLVMLDLYVENFPAQASKFVCVESIVQSSWKCCLVSPILWCEVHNIARAGPKPRQYCCMVCLATAKSLLVSNCCAQLVSLRVKNAASCRMGSLRVRSSF